MLRTTLGLSFAGICMASAVGHAQAARRKGDYVAYREAPTISARRSDIRCTHRHDWSAATLEARNRMIMGHQDPFLEDNDYAWLECVNERTRKTLFRVPVPALMVLWISPDGQYVVGLSDLKLLNPYQLVVYGIDGKLVYREHVAPTEACFTESEFREFLAQNAKRRSLLMSRSVLDGGRVYVDFLFMDAPKQFGTKLFNELFKHSCPSHLSPNMEETTSNWVDWYNESDPNISLVQGTDGKLIALTLLDRVGKPMTISFASQVTTSDPCCAK